MSDQLLVLCATAASIGFIHTALGPDHYLPFIVLGRARRWSRTRTLVITFLCGLGHVLSSVVLGAIGILAGTAVNRLEIIEGTRGELAAWTFICFGLVYMVWGISRAMRGDGHSHSHLHVHTNDCKPKTATPWILFTVFVLGPCEPLIPLLMYPAAVHGLWTAGIVALVFASVTITTMLIIVAAASEGVKFLPLARIERWTHAIAGCTICASGMAIEFLGL